MATYAVLREGRDGEALDDLEEQLGFERDDDDSDEPAEEEMVSAHTAEGRAIMMKFGGDLMTVA